MSVQIMRTPFQAQKLKAKVEDKPKAETIKPETVKVTEVKVTEVKSEVTEVRTEVTETKSETAEVVTEETKVTRAAETNEIVEVEKNIEASAEELEEKPEAEIEEKTEVVEENLEAAEELPEDELITATSSDEGTANESIMSVNKGQGSTDDSMKLIYSMTSRFYKVEL